MIKNIKYGGGEWPPGDPQKAELDARAARAKEVQKIQFEPRFGPNDFGGTDDPFAELPPELITAAAVLPNNPGSALGTDNGLRVAAADVTSLRASELVDTWRVWLPAILLQPGNEQHLRGAWLLANISDDDETNTSWLEYAAYNTRPATPSEIAQASVALRNELLRQLNDAESEIAQLSIALGQKTRDYEALHGVYLRGAPRSDAEGELRAELERVTKERDEAREGLDVITAQHSDVCKEFDALTARLQSEHDARWLDTYNAALTGAIGVNSSIENGHKAAAKYADGAHGKRGKP